ncbi:MAG: hypothetical protein PHP01_06900 [Phycisphaerae bacterium]|nr:hypothetical protein [Phycisphaerae bacterium]
MVKQNIRLAVPIILLGLYTITLANENSADNQSNGFGFSVFTLIEALGICALVSLLVIF